MGVVVILVDTTDVVSVAEQSAQKLFEGGHTHPAIAKATSVGTIAVT
jgi:hypothetical protein